MHRKFMILAASAAIAVIGSSFASVAAASLSKFHPDHPEIYPGAYVVKKDVEALEKSLETMSKELSDATSLFEKFQKDHEQHYKDLTNNFDGVKKSNDEITAEVKKRTDEYAEITKNMQACQQAVEQIKKEMDNPYFSGSEGDKKDADVKNAIELQRRIHLENGKPEHEFVPDMDKLVKGNDYRGAVQKLLQLGLKSKDEIVRTFTEGEKKAFDAASLDSAFFSPEMLGIELDCTVICAELLDLYESINVSRTNFMYMRIQDWGSIGQYDCDAKCDAEYGPEGNITYDNGKTFDFRGVFCFQKKVLAEANYDFLNFMMRAAMRSYRINRNRALISGDGINEPLGWLRSGLFSKVETPDNTLNHVSWRRFMSSAPVEYGPVRATMHQNVFAYLAAQTDRNSRFIFGDGLMTYSPDDVRENIRISNCLPDPTAGGTLGDADHPFVSGAFIAAAGNWERAYAVVNKRPMFMEQYIGQTSAWCVKYQFGAEDGGFVLCPPAARTLQFG